MIRPIRIGLLAEGKTELGDSITNIDPLRGGKTIDRTKEGVLHTLIRRELSSAGLPDCEFVHHHPTRDERKNAKPYTGYDSIRQTKYLGEVIIAWKPDEVDMIILVVDSDSKLEIREQNLKKALEIIQDNHLDHDENEIYDRSFTALAIRDIEAWLIADTDTLLEHFNLEINLIENLEEFAETKNILNDAIKKSNYLIGERLNQRQMQVRWNIAHKVNLKTLKTQCPRGYGTFAENLITTSQITKIYIDKL